MSSIIVDWKRYEYVTYSHNSTSSTNSLSKRVYLQEDKISVTVFLKKFEKEIYKYIKHSHRAQWQDMLTQKVSHLALYGPNHIHT